MPFIFIPLTPPYPTYHFQSSLYQPYRNTDRLQSLLITKNSADMTSSHFTEPTTNYWQEILPSDRDFSKPWKYGVPARLPDSRIFMLPIRPLSSKTNEAVASLLVNQASIDVVAELGAFLADVVRPFYPDAIIGLPTLGLSLAPIVAQHLGLSEFFFILWLKKRS